MTMITANFSVEELRCHHCGVYQCMQASVERLQQLRDVMAIPFTITSGYRCPVYNEQVSHTGAAGPHTKGQAFDIEIEGADALRLIVEARRLGFTGVGVSQNGPHGRRFVHLDDLSNEPGQPRPTIWSY